MSEEPDIEVIDEEDPEVLTEIPEGGWTEEHEGLEVRLKMPMGTVITDRIIGLPIGGGGAIFGPTQELGMILARADYAAQAVAAYSAWQNALGEDFE